jgi:hypothetical protein
VPDVPVSPRTRRRWRPRLNRRRAGPLDRPSSS